MNHIAVYCNMQCLIQKKKQENVNKWLEVLSEGRHLWSYCSSLTFWYRIQLSFLKSFFFATLYVTCWNVHEYSLQTKQNHPFILPLCAHLYVKVTGTKVREKMTSHNLIPKRISLLTADSITTVVICHTSQQPPHLWVPSLSSAEFPTLSHVSKYSNMQQSKGRQMLTYVK
jgi:hypothetical protein